MNPVDQLTDLIVETFRLNGRLLAAGDGLVADLGLTSARWQVLGAIAASPVPLPVASIARNMGLSRQGVQRLADLLTGEGFVRFDPNPHHARAKLLVLTDKGRQAFADAMARQRPWAASLSAGLDAGEIAAALRVATQLRERLDRAEPPEAL
ncbi:DNA-binding MarR family transcriptional regulator [Inquilinus ginsengisoli]|uniref:DNA-binding MarR family transcriptional regulator n=1 Tax=Inquilinus ginsengisoli TaxID=363840 RepID=A0ABU1JNT1_9PROT|nr:MarR family transcriptional regulator [Inquilinus ginsengisoli]MDR6289204.1 DNA-binding MarR family transcriptional regulator [Inquilinus ginsengisoli]